VQEVEVIPLLLGLYMGVGGDLYWIERPDASGVPVGVNPTTEREKQDINVGDWEEGNKTSLHMVANIDLYHKRVMGVHKG
jgi:hypothetical protein